MVDFFPPPFNFKEHAHFSSCEKKFFEICGINMTRRPQLMCKRWSSQRETHSEKKKEKKTMTSLWPSPKVSPVNARRGRRTVNAVKEQLRYASVDSVPSDRVHLIKGMDNLMSCLCPNPVVEQIHCPCTTGQDRSRHIVPQNRLNQTRCV